jgi:hypothetical protein
VVAADRDIEIDVKARMLATGGGVREGHDGENRSFAAKLVIESLRFALGLPPPCKIRRHTGRERRIVARL